MKPPFSDDIKNVNDIPLYMVWTMMKQRCYNTKCWAYKYYGERGIRVWDYWINNFPNFYYWALNNGYEKGLTLDRKENDLDYTPSNCRFITQADQMNNKRGLRQVNIDGTEMNISQWAKKLNISRYKVYKMIKENNIQSNSTYNRN